MINTASILAWNAVAPWSNMTMVEQDLIICRALVDIFSDEFLRNELAFRGGTALHKLYLQPQPRYSEDIDLVQIHPGPIKPILYRLGEVLSWMPDRVTKPKRYNNTILFRMESEFPPIEPIRLKVEINCGKCELTTYAFEELLGTKLRALYQRKKGRDLFDLQVALDNREVDVEKVLKCYNRYMEFVVGKAPTYKQFMQNMEMKMQDTEFLNDTDILLREGAAKFDPVHAFELVKRTLIDKLPGRRD